MKLKELTEISSTLTCSTLNWLRLAIAIPGSVTFCMQSLKEVTVQIKDLVVVLCGVHGFNAFIFQSSGIAIYNKYLFLFRLFQDGSVVI